MRPQLAWGLAAAALVLGSARPAAADLAEIKSRGTLRVLVAADEAPEMFSFKPDVSPGLEREMLEGFARLHKLKLDVIPVQRWDDIIPMLHKEEGDLITGIIDTEVRRKLVGFTVEILPARHLAVTRKPQGVIDTLEELQSAHVGVIAGTSWAEAAAGAGVPPEQIENLSDTAAVLEALRTKKVTAAVMSISDFTLSLRRDRQLQGGLFVGTAASAAWAFRKTDVELKRALNEYLENLRKSASWSRLIVKYFGEAALSVLLKARERPRSAP